MYTNNYISINCLRICYQQYREATATQKKTANRDGSLLSYIYNNAVTKYCPM